MIGVNIPKAMWTQVYTVQTFSQCLNILFIIIIVLNVGGKDKTTHKKIYLHLIKNNVCIKRSV